MTLYCLIFKHIPAKVEESGANPYKTLTACFALSFPVSPVYKCRRKEYRYRVLWDPSIISRAMQDI